MGAFDAKLVEKPVEGEQNRQMQAPNRASTWAQSQEPRAEAMTGPRFEQTIFELQVSILDRLYWNLSTVRKTDRMLMMYSLNHMPPLS